MTRTRQSAAHGRRGAFRKSAVSVKKKVHKSKTTPPAQKPAAKGRYTCLKCTKFSGPRKAVEDHCRQKHKLIGKKLESAVGISDEEKTTETNTTSSDKSKDVNKRKKVEMTEGPKSNVMDAAESPERGSKRLRSASDPADDMDKAAKRNHEGEPIEETPVTPQEADEIDTEKCDTSDETREQGKPSVEAPDSTETSGRTDGQHESSNQKTDNVTDREVDAMRTDGELMENTKSSSQEESLPNVSEMPGSEIIHSDGTGVNAAKQVTEPQPESVTQKAPANGKDHSKYTKKPPAKSSLTPTQIPHGTCPKCKRTFAKARQLTKHKCFAAMDDEPVATPKQKSASPRRAASGSKKSKPTKTPVISTKEQKTPKSEKAYKAKEGKDSSGPVENEKDEQIVPEEEEVKKDKDDVEMAEPEEDVLKSAITSTIEKDSLLEVVATKDGLEPILPPANVETSAKDISPQISSEEGEVSKEGEKEITDPVESDEVASEPVPDDENTCAEKKSARKDEDTKVVETAADDKPVRAKKKTVRPSRANKYEKLAKKMEELSDEDKEKISLSVMPRQYSGGMDLVGASEKVQLSVQNGGTFCLCNFCNKINLTTEQMQEHLCQHVKDYFPFQCKSCDFLSRKRGRITAHMKKAHGGYLQCQFCSYNTYDQEKLNRHYKYWNRDFNNSCQFCHKKVPEGTKEEHMMTVHGKKPEELVNINLTADAFTCRYCGERQKSRHARRDHEKRHDPHYTCPLCPYTTNGEAAFVNHGRKHRVILVCSECLTKFHSSQALLDHLKVHIAEDIASVQSNNDHLIQLLYERSIIQSIFVASALDEASIPECDIIGLDMNMRVREEERRVSQQNSGSTETGRPVATVVTVEEMKLLNFGSAYDAFIRNIEYRHLSMQTLSFMFARYGKRECSYCGFLLHSLGSWKIHTGSHEGKADLHCTECDYKCRHKFLLDRHILITHKKQDFGCDLCSKRFPYREYVYLHKRKDHYGGKMKCSFCVETEFNTEDEKVMKRHIIEEHPEMTSKQIAQIIGRKVHFTGRDGILFVKCKYCQKGFNRVAFLRQHVQLVHFKQKTFLCDQCGYKSNTSARLRTHMAVHTEKRDVTCDQCGAGFKNKVYLYKHIRRSHKRYATARGAAYCKRTRLKNMISLLQKERQEGSSYERQEIIQKEKAKLFGVDRSSVSVEGVRVEKSEQLDVKTEMPPTQINVFQCGDCGEYFESIASLKKHFTNVHGESPNIPLDFDAGTSSGTSDSEQVNIALDALNNGSASNSVNQLFQCAKCNRMFPDMKSVEHHVKEVHATDTFLISDEGNIPSQELDLAAEVIHHLTRETNQSGQIDVMHNVINQSALDALSIEAQDAASALTSLPDAVLESSQLQSQAELNSTVTYQIKTEETNISAGDAASSSSLSILSQGLNECGQGSGDGGATPNVEVVVSGRDDELEAAQLLQQMGIFQQFTTCSGDTTTTTSSDLQLDGSSTSVQIGEGQGELEGESVTIMVIEENPQK
ncbi:uncharacterized protein [Apostichopus japonicus]|uniref:uncharacterized protein isoform X2 n=1 Tax=Stichopus japonicus TaxID=307972 RepID=UPI003AB2EB85